jgi:hypothetical protein
MNHKPTIVWVGFVFATIGITAFASIAAASLTFSGSGVTANSAVVIDGSSTISIGTSTATGVTIGSPSSTVSFPGNVAVGSGVLGSFVVGTTTAVDNWDTYVRGIAFLSGTFGSAPSSGKKEDEIIHASGLWSGDQTADQYTNAVDVDAGLNVGARANFLSAVNAYVENDEDTLVTPWIAGFYANASYAAGTNTQNAAGLYVQPQRDYGTGALNTYGVYIDDDSSSHTANDWGLYVSGLVKKNYIGGPLQMGTSTYSALPSCNPAEEGTQHPVTDSTTSTLGAIITGSGSNHVLAYCDGTNWTVMAK